MQAAETGHLVLTTLHADTVAQAIGRIREFYPSSEQANVSSLLGRNINAILCQRLLPNVHGTRTPCLEILRRDAGVQEAVQTNNLHLLNGIIEVSINQGMHTFDQYLLELYSAGTVSRETVQAYAVHPHKVDMALRGFLSPAPILEPDEDR
jgi:twitching motility protein PilT